MNKIGYLTRLGLFLCTGFVAVAPTGSATDPAPEIHCKHFFYGYPEGTSTTNDLIIRDGYALLSND